MNEKLEKAFQVLGLDIQKGGEGSGRHKDSGHELSEKVEVYDNKIKSIKLRNLSLERRREYFIKESEGNSLKECEKEIKKNNNKIEELQKEISKIEKIYKPDSEFEE